MRIMQDLSLKVDRKFIESFATEDYEVWTESGWQPIKSSNKTVKYEIYELQTFEGLILKCADDHIVFKETGEQIFVKHLKPGDLIQSEGGIVTVSSVIATGKDVHMYDLEVGSNNHSYYTNGILSHNTTTVGAYLLWYLLFHNHKEIFVLANKEKQAIEILTRVRKSLLDMPFFLSPGVVKYGSTEIEFDNGSKIVTYSTSSDSIRGRSAAILYIDEVAFIENDMDFWESTYPAISQSKTSRVIMTSTPKGQRGLFYKTWMEAEEDENGICNGFFRVLVTWDKVPTYVKDPLWRGKQIKRLGGEARFKQEYECSFRGSVGTLISPTIIEQMVSCSPKLEPDEWTKVYRPYDPSRKYVGVVDVGGGTEGDYSVCRIMDVTSYPYKTAALYRNNKISPLIFPHVIVSMCEQYGNCWVLPETNNDMGGQAITVLYYDLEYEYVIKTGSDKKQGTGTKVGGKSSKPGIKTNSKTRSVGCSNMKSMIENDFILIDDLETIYELGNFVIKGDRYEADAGCNDDCVMTLVIFSWLSKQEWFLEEFGRNISKDMFKQATEERGFKLPLCGGAVHAEQDESGLSIEGEIKVVGDKSFVEWAGT